MANGNWQMTWKALLENDSFILEAKRDEERQAFVDKVLNLLSQEISERMNTHLGHYGHSRLQIEYRDRSAAELLDKKFLATDVMTAVNASKKFGLSPSPEEVVDRIMTYLIPQIAQP